MTTCEIPLSGGFTALVDAEDFERVAAYRWHPRKSGKHIYAQTGFRRPGGKSTTLQMHHLILPQQLGVEVDHRDGNGLDNRRTNLRYASRSQNQANTVFARRNSSGFKGVRRHKYGKLWQARISYENKQMYLGSFFIPEDAARAYDAKATELFGEFARLNSSRPEWVEGIEKKQARRSSRGSDG